jgi:hypothetical protein
MTQIQGRAAKSLKKELELLTEDDFVLSVVK